MDASTTNSTGQRTNYYRGSIIQQSTPTPSSLLFSSNITRYSPRQPSPLVVPQQSSSSTSFRLSNRSSLSSHRITPTSMQQIQNNTYNNIPSTQQLVTHLHRADHPQTTPTTSASTPSSYVDSFPSSAASVYGPLSSISTAMRPSVTISAVLSGMNHEVKTSDALESSSLSHRIIRTQATSARADQSTGSTATTATTSSTNQSATQYSTLNAPRPSFQQPHNQHRTVLVDSKTSTMIMSSGYLNNPTTDSHMATTITSNQSLIRSPNQSMLATGTTSSTAGTGSTRQAITALPNNRLAENSQSNQNRWSQQQRKSKQTVSATTRFSPSKMQADPKSVVGGVVSSPHFPHLCYRIEKVLQSAIYGAVFLAYEYPSAGGNRIRKTALKIMLKAVEKKHHGTLQEDITAELKFREDMLGHPNVLVFDHYWEDRESLFIVMPFAEFEDLFEVLRKRQLPFIESEARWLFRQLLSGAEFLHKKGIGFRDHSLENVLMFFDDKTRLLVPKITDPGQAVRFQLDATHRVKELYADKLFGKSFRPPEVYLKRTYNPIKVDIFCMGWMLFFTVTKHQIFDRAAEDDEHWKLIKHGRYDELLRQRGGTYLTKQLTHLLWKMLHPDPRHRPTAKECLGHPWFAEPEVPINERTVVGRLPLPRPLPPPPSQRPLPSPKRPSAAYHPVNVKIIGSLPTPTAPQESPSPTVIRSPRFSEVAPNNKNDSPPNTVRPFPVQRGQPPQINQISSTDATTKQNSTVPASKQHPPSKPSSKTDRRSLHQSHRSSVTQSSSTPTSLPLKSTTTQLPTRRTSPSSTDQSIPNPSTSTLYTIPASKSSQPSKSTSNLPLPNKTVSNASSTTSHVLSSTASLNTQISPHRNSHTDVQFLPDWARPADHPIVSQRGIVDVELGQAEHHYQHPDEPRPAMIVSTRGDVNSVVEYPPSAVSYSGRVCENPPSDIMTVPRPTSSSRRQPVGVTPSRRVSKDKPSNTSIRGTVRPRARRRSSATAAGDGSASSSHLSKRQQQQQQQPRSPSTLPHTTGYLDPYTRHQRPGFRRDEALFEEVESGVRTSEMMAVKAKGAESTPSNSRRIAGEDMRCSSKKGADRPMAPQPERFEQIGNRLPGGIVEPTSGLTESTMGESSAEAVDFVPGKLPGSGPQQGADQDEEEDRSTSEGTPTTAHQTQLEEDLIDQQSDHQDGDASPDSFINSIDFEEPRPKPSHHRSIQAYQARPSTLPANPFPDAASIQEIITIVPKLSAVSIIEKLVDSTESPETHRLQQTPTSDDRDSCHSMTPIQSNILQNNSTEPFRVQSPPDSKHDAPIGVNNDLSTTPAPATHMTPPPVDSLPSLCNINDGSTKPPTSYSEATTETIVMKLHAPGRSLSRKRSPPANGAALIRIPSVNRRRDFPVASKRNSVDKSFQPLECPEGHCANTDDTVETDTSIETTRSVQQEVQIDEDRRREGDECVQNKTEATTVLEESMDDGNCSKEIDAPDDDDQNDDGTSNIVVTRKQSEIRLSLFGALKVKNSNGDSVARPELKSEPLLSNQSSINSKSSGRSSRASHNKSKGLRRVKSGKQSQGRTTIEEDAQDNSRPSFPTTIVPCLSGHNVVNTQPQLTEVNLRSSGLRLPLEQVLQRAASLSSSSYYTGSRHHSSNTNIMATATMGSLSNMLMTPPHNRASMALPSPHHHSSSISLIGAYSSHHPHLNSSATHPQSSKVEIPITDRRNLSSSASMSSINSSFDMASARRITKLRLSNGRPSTREYRVSDSHNGSAISPLASASPSATPRLSRPYCDDPSNEGGYQRPESPRGNVHKLELVALLDQWTRKLQESNSKLPSRRESKNDAIASSSRIRQESPQPRDQPQKMPLQVSSLQPTKTDQAFLSARKQRASMPSPEQTEEKETAPAPPTQPKRTSSKSAQPKNSGSSVKVMKTQSTSSVASSTLTAVEPQRSRGSISGRQMLATSKEGTFESTENSGSELVDSPRRPRSPLRRDAPGICSSNTEAGSNNKSSNNRLRVSQYCAPFITPLSTTNPTVQCSPLATSRVFHDSLSNKLIPMESPLAPNSIISTTASTTPMTSMTSPPSSSQTTLQHWASFRSSRTPMESPIAPLSTNNTTPSPSHYFTSHSASTATSRRTFDPSDTSTLSSVLRSSQSPNHWRSRFDMSSSGSGQFSWKDVDSTGRAALVGGSPLRRENSNRDPAALRCALSSATSGLSPGAAGRISRPELQQPAARASLSVRTPIGVAKDVGSPPDSRHTTMRNSHLVNNSNTTATTIANGRASMYGVTRGTVSGVSPTRIAPTSYKGTIDAPRAAYADDRHSFSLIPSTHQHHHYQHDGSTSIAGSNSYAPSRASLEWKSYGSTQGMTRA